MFSVVYLIVLIYIFFFLRFTIHCVVFLIYFTMVPKLKITFYF